MKTVHIVISLILSILVVHLYIQNRNRQTELDQSYYALRNLHGQLERDLNKNWTAIGEKRLELNDSIVEMHRIWSTEGNKNFVLKLECRKDGSQRSVLKQFTLKNPLTGEGKTEVVASIIQLANPTDLAAFKTQLSNIQLATAAISGEEIMCCFGGGTITWEARMPDGEFYRFSTYCGKSVEFANACAELLENCGLSELKSR